MADDVMKSSSNESVQEMLPTSTTTTTKEKSSSSNGAAAAAAGTGGIIANEFKLKLDSLLESKAHLSKDKMTQIVEEAVKAVKYYKHVVYYVESFIKKVDNIN